MYKIYQNIFLYGLNASYVLYFLAILGAGSLAPEYLSSLRGFLKIYIGLLLIGLYNPITYKDRNFTDIDRKMAFSAGVFLLLSTTLVSSMEAYLIEKTNSEIIFDRFGFVRV
jgi:hypothetical protein